MFYFIMCSKYYFIIYNIKWLKEILANQKIKIQKNQNQLVKFIKKKTY